MFTVPMTLAAMLVAQGAPPGKEEALGKMLTSGKLADVERQLMADLAVKPDDAARMTLGTTKFLRAIEDYARTMRRFGLNHKASVLGSAVTGVRAPTGARLTMFCGFSSNTILVA